ncbi:MAG: hypothetical protein EX260_11785 [Desulfobulbaceae bacterium]|nr:MAG: hypothetical protein EX260_11785 [Desulfobulbaceae bacterium]
MIKPLIIMVISLFLVLSSVPAFATSCQMLSEINIDQYVHVVFKSTPRGHIKGKVLNVDESNCMLTISTTDEYRTYYVDVSCVAAIGTK